MDAATIAGIFFVILFSLLFCLTVHELGHFAFAKAFGINVRELAIGFGPALWRTYTPKTHMRVSVRLLPIGAYVLLDSEGVRSAYLDDPNAKQYGFYMRVKPGRTLLLEQAPYARQMAIMFAGIGFNLLTFLVFFAAWSAANPGAVLDFSSFLKNVFVGIGHAFVLYGVWPHGAGMPADGSAFAGVRVNGDFLLRYLLSINLATAILNVIPVSPLDGWKIMQLTYERCTKRKLPERTMAVLATVGAAAILWVTVGGVVNMAVSG